jgi:nucleotide-binding universal stress UspA family protein
MTQQRIVVGLDGSPRQPAVLEAAAELAELRGAELHLVRAMSVPMSLPAVLWSLKGDDLSEFLVEHGTKELTTAAEGIEGTKTELHCKIGQPAEVLCEIATRTGAQLVVIGTHGYDRIDRVLGTTAAKVVNQAPCSVYVVRD